MASVAETIDLLDRTDDVSGDSSEANIRSPEPREIFVVTQPTNSRNVVRVR